MKTALKIISGVVLTLLIVGVFTRETEGTFRILFPLGWLLFAFLWMPFFLLYRYDKYRFEREQRQKERQDEDQGES